MKKKYHMSSLWLVQLAVGLYFSISGLLGIIGYNSGFNQLVRSVGGSSYVPLLISISFLLAGIILFAGVIFNLKIRVAYFIILVLWVVYIVINYFSDNFLKPELLVWLKNLSMQLIVLSGLWAIYQRK